MKPGVFTQLYIQFVFAVQHRQALLRNKANRAKVCRYISGIITNMKCKSIIVNGVADHVHVFLGLHHTVSISDLAGEIKRSASHFINGQKWFAGKFNWQDGYGAFSYGRSQIDTVYRYIENQEMHHKRKSFRKEYIELLKKYDIPYDERYLFRFFED
jgi:REP element-mobilizing transposase RayT